MCLIQVYEPPEDALSDLAEHIDSYRTKIFRYPVERPAVHVFHTQKNVSGFVLERSVEGDDIGRAAVVPNLQLSHNLFADILLGVNTNNL